MTDMREQYLRFVAERHRVWERRQGDPAGPWTEDFILQHRKFCNVFRLLDHGSQFVAKELLHHDDDIGDEDALMRAFLYRYTNRPDPFVFFHQEHGRYPLVRDLTGRLQDTWGLHKRLGGKFFSGAYAIFVGTENKGMTRDEWVLSLVHRAFAGASPHRIWPAFQEVADSRAAQHAVLGTLPRVADFMGMQVLTDWGYWRSAGDRENEFVVPGPGSARGVRRIDPAVAKRGLVPFMRELHTEVLSMDGVPQIGSTTTPPRLPSIMDIQNTLCEFDKYVRHLKGEVRGRTFRPAHPQAQPAPYIPAHWN